VHLHPHLVVLGEHILSYEATPSGSYLLLIFHLGFFKAILHEALNRSSNGAESRAYSGAWTGSSTHLRTNYHSSTSTLNSAKSLISP
jgi:hypothetical protein